MAGPKDRAEEAALWERWRLAAAPGDAGAMEPDALLLAAYVEDRLTPQSAEAVETWLASHPDSVVDIRAAREAAHGPLPDSPAVIVARAAALVLDGEAKVLPFRRPSPHRLASWRTAAVWGGMAASLLLTSLVGFTLGTSVSPVATPRATPALAQDLLDPPTGLFNSLDEDSNT
jgi:hypothetical protein